MARFQFKPGRFLVLAAVLIAASSCGDDGEDVVRRPQGDNKSDVVSSDKSTSTSSSTPKRRLDLELVANGFSGFRPQYADSDATSYAVVLRNPNPDSWIASRVDVNASLFDSKGTVVKSTSDTVSMVLPGQTVAVADSFSDVSGVVRMEAKMLVHNWAKTDEPMGAFTTEGITTKTQRFGGLKTNGLVRSTFAKDLKTVQVVAVYSNSAGAIVGGAYTFVDFVPAGGSIGFEVSSLYPIPHVVKTDAYVAITSLSALDN